MKEIRFNINEKPKTQDEDVAYLVDINNVDLIAQYVEKYYADKPEFWTRPCIDWYNEHIGNDIRMHTDTTYIIYFGEWSLGWDDTYNAVAYEYNYDIYHIVPQPTLMTLE